MYVQVRLLKGFPKPLWYKVPSSLKNNKLAGVIVSVPLKEKIVSALVLSVSSALPTHTSFTVKELHGIEALPPDPLHQPFIEHIAPHYFLEPVHFFTRIRSFLLSRSKTTHTNVTAKDAGTQHGSITLTSAQETVVSYVTPHIETSSYAPTLLHGVTGSGKTEVYKRLITAALNAGKSIILLHPEVTLSLQFQRLLTKTLPRDTPIYGFHSAVGAKEKRALWDDLKKGTPLLILGVHLPILLPIPQLGLIIIDEEHEPGFTEKKHPKLNSKELAIWRAHFYGIPILLGSATPSLTSLHNVKTKGWKFFQLTQRFAGAFPKVITAPLTAKEPRAQFWITNTLKNKLKECLEKKEQALIYLNRRGYSFFVKCKQCSFIFSCPQCSVSLTVHSQDDGIYLLCHYCSHKKALPTHCPTCKSKDLLRKGIGTQQIVTKLQTMFPTARIARADLDTTKKKRAWQDTVEAFDKGEIDILIGTQTITKGYHFPKVTLVGILWADLNLHFPVYNASETTLQQLIQVSGRAGRGGPESCVVVQTMGDHAIFKYLNETDYLDFYEQELSFRKAANYPPYCKFMHLELRSTNPVILDKETETLFNLLAEAQEKDNIPIAILGPVKPAVYKVQNIESRHIFFKSETYGTLHALLKDIDLSTFKSGIFIVPSA